MSPAIGGAPILSTRYSSKGTVQIFAQGGIPPGGKGSENRGPLGNEGGAPPPFGGPPNYPPPGYVPPGYTPPGFGSGDPDAYRDLRRSADRWFLLSLLTIPCCCALGVAGAIFAYQAKDLLAQQRAEEAFLKVQNARLITSIGLGLVVLIVLVQVVMIVLGALQTTIRFGH